MWSKADLRRAMLLEKTFLYSIHQANSITVCAIIAGATNLQINILIRVLHFISSGQIPLEPSVIERLSSSKKAGHLTKNFKQKSAVKKLLSEPRQERVASLNKIHKFLPQLLERYVTHN